MGRSPIFGQLSDKLLLVLSIHVGVPDLRHKTWVEILNAENLLARRTTNEVDRAMSAYPEKRHCGGLYVALCQKRSKDLLQ